MANPNPQLVAAIRRQPAYLQLPLLTTALIESGGRLDAVGDQGQSFGPYQEYTGGRGAGIPPKQRMDPFASTQRAAREFQTFFGRGARGADLAYRAQRPADRASYVAKYNSLLPEAQRILGQAGSAPAGPATPQAAEATPPDLGRFLPSRVRPGNVELMPAALDWLQGYQSVSRNDLLSGRPFGAAGEFRASEQYDPLALLERPGVRVTAPQITGFRPSVQDAVADADVAGVARGGAPVGGGFTMGGGPEAHHSRALGNWQSDDAYDLMGKAGQAVVSTIAGRVSKISGKPGGRPGFAGYGITIETPQGKLFFKHLGSTPLRVGSQIRPGALIGTLDSKTAGGPHLHLGGTSRGLLDAIARAYTGRR